MPPKAKGKFVGGVRTRSKALIRDAKSECYRKRLNVRQFAMEISGFIGAKINVETVRQWFAKGRKGGLHGETALALVAWLEASRGGKIVRLRGKAPKRRSPDLLPPIL